MKVDRRKNYYVVLDTETCPIDKEYEGVSANNMFTYDIGFAIIDKKGRVYEKFSYIVKEIFFGEKDLMQSAYYASKIPMYEEQIQDGSRKVATLYDIRKCLKEVMEKYSTNIVMCHNARFDDITLKITQRWLTKSKFRYFLPFGTEVWDTLKMARDILGKRKSYISWCKSNGYMTKNGLPRMTAEIIYRYISGNEDFVESHTGLEDVMIEKEIFAFCMRQHKPMRKALYN